MMTATRSLISVRAQGHSSREEGALPREQKLEHVPVMVTEVLAALALRRGDMVVDATFGQGGHSRAMQAAAKIKLIAIDADPASKGSPCINTRAALGFEVIEANFGDIEKVLKKLEIKKIDKALFDLGWNRGQLDSGRGFSFLRDEPLLMYYGAAPASGFSAAEILNSWSERALADAFFGYGEERYARRIARAVVERRNIKKIETTFELVEIIRTNVPAAYRRGRLNPATKVFQALRIAANNELGVLEKGLRGAWKHLAKNGRIAVITFHSVEDRLVKRLFIEFCGHLVSTGRRLYKKPIIPIREEIFANPSARSAKLRAVEKL